MKTKEFLELLDEPEVIEKIVKIVMNYKNANNDSFYDAALKQDNRQEVTELKLKIEQLQTEITALTETNKNLKSQAEFLNNAIEKYNIEASETAAKYKKLDENYGQLLAENKYLEDKIALLNKEKAHIENGKADLHRQNETLQQQFESQNSKIKALEQKLAEESEQLKLRFGEGWALYTEFLQLEASEKQILKSVFPAENFEAFICGGAKDASLEKIWDEVDRNLKNNTQMAYLLWKIFEYFLRLANNAKIETVYKIDDVKTGDDYDKKIHRLDADSRVQGKVRKVILPGFSNIYNNENIRKTIVHVE